MKAALCKSFDGPDAITIEEIPDPEPGPGEVRVRVKAAALNFFDGLVTRGKYQFKPKLPFSPSSEMAGVVDRLGAGVTDLAVGDRVMTYMLLPNCARELVVIPAAAATRIPAGVGDEVAAGLSVTYGTAMHGLKDRGRLKAGETVAVLGASGGAGLAAVEVAKRLGARVIAVASSEQKLAVCKDHGADDLLNYAAQDLKQGLRDLTGGKGVDVIYDCVGGDHAEQALRSIAWYGRFLVIGFAAGQIPRIPLNLALLKSCDIVGVFWGEWSTRFPAENRANMAEVIGWIARGELKPHVHARYPLERVAEAIRLMEERRSTGKVVITM